MKRNIPIILSLISFLFAYLGMAQAQTYMFKRLEVKDGLPNNQVNSILKDREGFMWIATASGLARYDGYQFKVYHHNEGDPTTLPDNYVERLSEDAEGNIWMRTGQWRYTIFNPKTETFTTDIRPLTRQIGIDHDPKLLYHDCTLNTWFFVQGHGLYRYSMGENHTDSLLFSKNQLPQGDITNVMECSEGLLLVYNDGRLACIDTNHCKLKWIQDYIQKTMKNQKTEEYTIFVDAEETIWIYGIPGLWSFNPTTQEWTAFKEFGIMGKKHNLVHAISQDRDGRIWIGSDPEGICIYDKSTKKMSFLINDPNDDRSIPHNTIQSLYRDPEGLMWVGTYKKGLAYYDESIYKFRLYSLGDINMIELDQKSGKLWLGLNDGGLLHYDPATQTRKLYAHGGENSLSSNTIVALHQAKNGKLWIGTFFGGLDCFDGQTFRHYRHQNDNPNSLANDNVWTLDEDKDGNIWIGTLGGGVQKLDPRTNTFTTYTAANSGLVSDYIASICMSRNGELLVGTASSGLSILNVKTGKARTIKGTKDGTKNFTNANTNQVFEDSRGFIWYATRDGLNLYDPQTDWLKNDFFKDIKADRFVSGIAEDSNGSMWITTSDGLLNIAMVGQGKNYDFRLFRYDHKDGLQGSDFNQRSIKRLPTGEIAMGGLYGVNAFNPDRVKYNRMLPRVHFTALELFNENIEVGKKYKGKVILPSSLNTIEKVVLDYTQNVLSVLFAADNYILPEKTVYHYRLIGFDKEWMTCTADMHRAVYTNLSPGTYELQVKATNSDGFAGTQVSKLRIEIRPPFWMSPLAYFLYFFLIVGIIGRVFYVMMRRERRRYKQHQKEQEARKNEEVNQMKFRFFTNVSHELRTPLTLIISPLEGMMKNYNDPKLLRQLELMHRNAQRLLNLVNQLLDFRKNEIVGLHLTRSEGDLVGYVRNICSSFLMLSEKKQVHLTFYSTLKTLNMSFDEDKMNKIVMNLLSNAFKFTPEGGRVDVSVELSTTVPNHVLIKVADTGIGIKDEDKERIFERFYQADQDSTESQQTGSGIGLSLVRDFVTMHEGTVRVVDNVGKGSVFLVEIPIIHSQNSKTGDSSGQETGMRDKATSTEGDKTENTADNNGAIGIAEDFTAIMATDKAERAADNTEKVIGKAKKTTAPTEQKAIYSEEAEKDAAVEAAKPIALIVDDNEDLLQFIADSLSFYFQVHTAANGQEAWKMIPDLKPDIIVSDVMMPVMDGNELCRWVKSDPRTQMIPYILLTAKKEVEDKVESLSLGADDYVTKPFNAEVLVLRMKKLIELSRKKNPKTRIDPHPSEVEVTPIDEQLIATAVKYVEDNISRTDLSVEELSQALSMSRVHLYKKLMQITGKAPIEFIRIIRVKRAAQLLKDSQLNVSEVAYQVGFNSPKLFSKYFKDEFGMQPSAYQEKESRGRGSYNFGEDK